eukprot:8723526-Karenia_brevis.AAC.1
MPNTCEAVQQQAGISTNCNEAPRVSGEQRHAHVFQICKHAPSPMWQVPPLGLGAINVIRRVCLCPKRETAHLTKTA